jgi:hypothetical protein
MKSIWFKSLGIAVFALYAGGIALIDMYPYRPRSTIGWCLLFILALPLWFFFEFIGERFTASRFITSLGRGTRITLGVFVLGGFVLAIIVVFWFLAPFLNKWGS